jgi:hypothetical protein
MPDGGADLVKEAGGPDQTQYTLDRRALRPAYHAVRAIFYGGSDKYSMHKASKLAEVMVRDTATFRCAGVKQLGIPPHDAPLRVDDETFSALDHKGSVAAHWNKTGRKVPHSERERFYADPDNLEVLCKTCNSKKGSLDETGAARDKYSKEVEIPRFAGPDGNV